MIDRRTMVLGCAATAFIRRPSDAQEQIVTKLHALKAASSRPDSLAGVAARAGLLFGTSAHSRNFFPGSSYDEAYRALVLRECSLLVPEYGASPDATRQSQLGFDFSLVDPLADLAAQHGIAFSADHLVWHGAIPAWVIRTITDRDAALAEMLLEVTMVASHLAGRIYYWVVANEVIYPSDKEANGLRKSFWYDKIGPDYINRAFMAAREADPKALLLINDHGLEADHPSDATKRQAMLKLLRTLRSSNAPIDGLGLESHLRADRRYDPDVLGGFLDEVHSLGLKIFITELDVQDNTLPSDVEARDATVAQLIGDYLNVVTHHPGLESINSWGLSDSHSWYNSASTAAFLRRQDGLPSRGTPFDQNLRPKAAYNAIHSALSTLSTLKHT